MSKKIFIGLSNISSIIPSLVYGFEKLNFKTLTAVHTITSPIITTQIDYNFSKMKRYWFGGLRPRSLQFKLQEYFKPENRIWRKAKKECDTFIFIWDSFKKDFSDYEILKKEGKTIITLFVGSDIRWYNAMKQHFISLNLEPIKYESYDLSLNHLETKLRYLRTVEKYSDAIFSMPTQSQLGLRPYQYFNFPCIIEKIPHNPFQRKIPHIIHAPSDRKIKGTETILKAIDILKNEGLSFEFELLENIPNEVIIEKYADADIVVGQLSKVLGKQGVEVLSCGTVLATGLSRECVLSDVYLKENPAVHIDINNIVEKLRFLILNYDVRVELAQKGRAFTEKYHDVKLFCNHILQAVNTSYDKKNNYVHPLFFREDYIPESKEAINIYNNWTNYVSDCDWYKKNIKSGERSGLVF